MLITLAHCCNTHVKMSQSSVQRIQCKWKSCLLPSSRLDLHFVHEENPNTITENTVKNHCTKPGTVVHPVTPAVLETEARQKEEMAKRKSVPNTTSLALISTAQGQILWERRTTQVLSPGQPQKPRNCLGSHSIMKTRIGKLMVPLVYSTYVSQA